MAYAQTLPITKILYKCIQQGWRTAFWTESSSTSILSAYQQCRLSWACAKSVCPYAVWSEPLYSVWRNVEPLTTHKAPVQDSDQSEQMCRLISVFDGCTCQLVPLARHLLILQFLAITGYFLSTTAQLIMYQTCEQMIADSNSTHKWFLFDLILYVPSTIFQL